MAELGLLLVIILVLGGFGLIYYLLKYELPRSDEPPRVVVIRGVPETPPRPPQRVVTVRRIVVFGRRPPPY
jgi:hypothetical protein